MIEQSDCRPQEIVYIEDNDRYAEPARELGVRVLLYSKGEIRKLEAELHALGVRV
jgi:FMN phosphatase YigB (HAD superfamily)